MVLQGEHRGEKGVSEEGLGGHLRRVQELYGLITPGLPMQSGETCSSRLVSGTLDLL